MPDTPVFPVCIMPHPDRTRPVRIEFCVTEQENLLIQRKMEQLGTKNKGAYLRKMAIDGYIIKVDYTEAKRLATAVNKVSAKNTA